MSLRSNPNNIAVYSPRSAPAQPPLYHDVKASRTQHPKPVPMTADRIAGSAFYQALELFHVRQVFVTAR